MLFLSGLNVIIKLFNFLFLVLSMLDLFFWIFIRFGMCLMGMFDCFGIEVK